MSNDELEMARPQLNSPLAECELFGGRADLDTSGWPQFIPGDRVRIERGVFAEAEGIVMECQRSGRLLLAVDVEQPGVTLEIDASALQSID
jgi:hypothetical protein